MARIATDAALAILWVFVANPMPAKAEPSLVGAWQHCEPGKGCLKFAFMPNGQVIEQFPLSGSIVTAYGRYHVGGTTLKTDWKRFAPPQVCTPSLATAGNNSRQCEPATQSDFEGSFHFEGLNALLWLKIDEPPLRLLRTEL